MLETLQAHERLDRAVAACMGERGLPYAQAEVDGSASYSADGVPPAQVERLQAAAYECWEESEPLAGFVDYPTGTVYDQSVETWECLAAQGYDLPDPPSKASWVEGFDAGEEVWAPYMDLYEQDPEIEESEWFRLKGICVESGIVFSPDLSDPPAGLGS